MINSASEDNSLDHKDIDKDNGVTPVASDQFRAMAVFGQWTGTSGKF